MTPTVAVLHNLGFGGARRRLAEQVAHLGLDVVEVTTSEAEPITDRPVVVPLRRRAEAVPAALRPPLRWLDLSAIERTWTTMGRLAVSSGADVVMTNPDRFLKGAVPVGVTEMPVIAYVDEPRRIDHEPALASTLNPTTRALYAPLRRREAAIDQAAVGAATSILTNSAYSVARISSAYGRDARVAPCGVPSAFLERPLCTGPFTHILTVGTPIPTKGHELVIRAAADSRLGLPVVLVTGHDGGDVPRLRRIAAALGVDLDVRLRVSDTDLQDLLGRALATVYLAQAEPLGLVSLEAQAVGCPVVVADEGGLPETVEHGNTGFAVPRTVESAADALRCLADRDRRIVMGEAARRRARSLTWEIASARLRDEIVATLEASGAAIR